MEHNNYEALSAIVDEVVGLKGDQGNQVELTITEVSQNKMDGDGGTRFRLFIAVTPAFLSLRYLPLHQQINFVGLGFQLKTQAFVEFFGRVVMFHMDTNGSAAGSGLLKQLFK